MKRSLAAEYSNLTLGIVDSVYSMRAQMFVEFFSSPFQAHRSLFVTKFWLGFMFRGVIIVKICIECRMSCSRWCSLIPLLKDNIFNLIITGVLMLQMDLTVITFLSSSRHWGLWWCGSRMTGSTSWSFSWKIIHFKCLQFFTWHKNNSSWNKP